MLNSRDIRKLRPDVYENCRVLVQRCIKAGYPILITGTVRDDEFQMDCFKRGTGRKPPATFHSVKAGLAFDICKNVKGQEYSDGAFFAGVAKIAKEMGFSWGGDWSDFVDKPHFQWDQHGKFRGRDIIAGRMPPPMPLYKVKEDEEMNAQDVRDIVDAMLAKRIEEERNAAVDAYARDAFKKAKEAGLMDGTMPQAPVTRQQLAVVLERAGVLK